MGDRKEFLPLQPSRRPALSNLADGAGEEGPPPALEKGVRRQRQGASLLKVKSCDVFRVDGLKGGWREIRGCY